MDFKVKVMIILVSIIFITVGGYVSWKFYNLNSKIGYLEETIETKDKTIVDLNLKLITSESNVNELRLSIEESNNKILQNSLKQKELLAEVDKWKNKPAEIKYVDKVVKTIVKETKYVKGNCEDGLELNRMIGGLKYENLK